LGDVAGKGAGFAAGDAEGAGAAGAGFGLPVAEVGEFLSNGLNPNPAEKAGTEMNTEIKIAENLSMSRLLHNFLYIAFTNEYILEKD
jgi:hypothetical protein